MKVKKCITIEQEEDDFITRERINLSKAVQKLVEDMIILKKYSSGLPKT